MKASLHKNSHIQLKASLHKNSQYIQPAGFPATAMDGGSAGREAVSE
jgi:hypothetical protein